MRILLISDRFPPDVGGIERMSELLAAQFARRGHEVTVVTHTPEPVALDNPYVRVLGAPRASQLLQAHRWADVVFHNNICLRLIWPQLLLRRPLVIAVRTWIRRADGRLGLRDRLKRTVIARYPTISISAAIAADLGSTSIVIPNSYRDDQFYITSEPAERERDFVFVGRLVSDKGADLAIRALARLKQSGIKTNLTVVGDGPDRESLTELARAEEVEEEVDLVGAADAAGVRIEFNRHRFAMLPSRWDEPFGVVALEAIACGCVPLVTRGGGLGEAVGPAGLTVPNGDLDALAEGARRLLHDDVLVDLLRSEGHRHIQAHQADAMAAAYLDVLEDAVADS